MFSDVQTLIINPLLNKHSRMRQGRNSKNMFLLREKEILHTGQRADEEKLDSLFSAYRFGKPERS